MRKLLAKKLIAFASEGERHKYFSKEK